MGAIWPTGILTCNQGVLRTPLFKSVGGFDEAFRDYGIDVDLTAKVLLAGYEVAHTKMVAIHHHRDHQTAPGAIANDQRAGRLTAAGELYRRKYAHLLPIPFIDRLKRPFREMAWFAVQVARKLLGAETVLGYNMSDWSNVLHGRYIDDFDLWINKEKPFYLIQRIPDALLRQ
jgi:hypothetical protein